MRILKVLFALIVAVLSVAAGFVVFAVVAAVFVLFLLVRWVWRRFAPDRSRPVRPVPANSDVIDVTATEVRSGDLPPGRQQ